MRRLCHIACMVIAAIAVLRLAVACAPARHAGELSDENKRQLYNYLYAEAQRQRSLDNEDAAFALFNEAAQIDTTAAATQYLLAQYYLSIDQQRAYELLRRAADNDTAQFWYNYAYARVANLTHDPDEASRILNRLIRLNPDKPALYSELARAYIAQGNYEAAHECYDLQEKYAGASDDITSQRIDLYALQNDTNALIALTERMHKENPGDVSYMILLGDIYTTVGRDSLAWSYYEMAAETDPSMPYLYISRADFYLAHGDTVAYHKEIHDAINNTDIASEVKDHILYNYATSTQIDNRPYLKELCIAMTEQYPQDVFVRRLYGEYLMKNEENYEAAREQYVIATDLDPNNLDAWLSLISVNYALYDLTAVTEVGKKATTYFPTEPRLYWAISTAYTADAQWDEAIATIHEGIEKCPDATPYVLSHFFYGSLGDSYYSKGEVDSAYASYETALLHDADNAAVLNNYSYFLSQEGRDLSRAERMSRSAIEQEPDNATYIDTYAWILYKQGSYSLARIYMERALEKSDEPEPEMLDHYGDILQALGENEAAIAQWTLAIEAGGDAEEIQPKIDNLKKSDQ